MHARSPPLSVKELAKEMPPQHPHPFNFRHRHTRGQMKALTRFFFSSSFVAYVVGERLFFVPLPSSFLINGGKRMNCVFVDFFKEEKNVISFSFRRPDFFDQVRKRQASSHFASIMACAPLQCWHVPIKGEKGGEAW